MSMELRILLKEKAFNLGLVQMNTIGKIKVQSKKLYAFIMFVI